MIYDLVIIGGSAAASTAAIYAARRELNFLVIAKDLGGEVATSGEIGNWPGVIQTDGLVLADQFKAHVLSYGVEPREGVEVKSIEQLADMTFKIVAIENEQPVEFMARSVIVATGVHPKELNVPGEKEFRGKGVTYCTTCDGPLFAGKVTTVIGGGNSALEAALMLSEIATKVYVINKNDVFKGDNVLLDNLLEKSNVEIIYGAKTQEIKGEGFVYAVTYIDKDGSSKEIKTDGVFVHIGQIPNSQIVPPSVEKNAFGEVVVNGNCETNMPGLYAAGDVTNVPFKQIVIAAGQGCIAVLSAVQYLNRLSK